MRISIEISESVYKQLINCKTRMRGSLALTTAKLGNFNVHARKPKKVVPHKKLAHGRVSITSEKVCLSMTISKRETGVNPVSVIKKESVCASKFVAEQIKAENNEVNDIIDKQ